VKQITAAILLTSLTLLAGCDAGSTPSAVPAGPAAGTVYIVDRGWHTDIGLAAADIHGPLAAVAQPFPGVRYMTFGFGERAFYASRHTDFFTMLAALFPSRAAILVTALSVPPADAFGKTQVVALPLTAAGLTRLDAFLWSYLRKGDNGQPQFLAPGPYSGSLFYAATGTYDASFTCNTWTVEGLHVAGLPISPDGVVFAGEVMTRVRALALRTGRRLAVGTGDGGIWRNDDGGVGRGRRRIAAAEAQAAAERERNQENE
jgi:uncharacterized protein (TIGR02117 family)